MGYTVPMDDIYDAYVAATRTLSAAGIARELGIPRQRLYDYASRGYLGRADRIALQAWLTRHGFLDTGDTTSSPAVASVARAVASELRGLAEILESELPGEEKARRFCLLLEAYGQAKEIYRAALQKEGDS